MFHDGPPHHTHQHCSHCLQMQRTHQAKLALCSSCEIAMYCSKECQVAHWPAHKKQCKLNKAERLSIAEKSGIASAIPDLTAWVRYYDTPLKTLAAMRLPENPHMERKAILFVHLHHTGDLTVPIHQRFAVMSVSRRESGDISPLSPLRPALARYPEVCERGKIELGEDFYGCVRFALTVTFGGECEAPKTITERMVQFSIDKETARANIVRQDWWILFREYVELGAKIKFCCGRLPGVEDLCCCGGWVHDAEKRKAFTEIGK
ncbi:hypothetical protein B0H19DRAFT_1255254 [Mycena capillaripes]|nr:hypothetical protein B0H19DRAFT_1255254 [Mycena capillaripes]